VDPFKRTRKTKQTAYVAVSGNYIESELATELKDVEV
jgi:hypothetical protein